MTHSSSYLSPCLSTMTLGSLRNYGTWQWTEQVSPVLNLPPVVLTDWDLALNANEPTLFLDC